MSAPDLIAHDGRIHTLDTSSRTVSALAVREGTIVAVGWDAEVLPLGGAGTRRVDPARRAVVPGFYDAHSHPGTSPRDAFRTVTIRTAPPPTIRWSISSPRSASRWATSARCTTRSTTGWIRCRASARCSSRAGR